MHKNDSKTWSLFSLKTLIPAAIILLAAVAAYAMVATAPKARKKAPAAIRPTVETESVSPASRRVWVPAMGTVVAAREISLEARVSGEVKTVSAMFVPGGFFKVGEEILTIDPEDYALALSEVQSEVASAEYDLKVERGYQNVSAREWDLLKGTAQGTKADEELALRKPHLEKAKAALKAAKAKLKQARLDLERTRITAPFAAMVEAKSTDIGATVSEQETLATLVGTEEFWIEASVPTDRLGWIDIPVNGASEGAQVRILSGSGANRTEREGTVIRLLPSLESEGRMARLLISVKDPLNLAGNADVKPLLLGSYVSVQIDGGTLDGVYAIPRTAFRENSTVWVLSDKGTLDIRTLDPVWRDNDSVVFDQGLAQGEQVVTSNLSAPIQGMALRGAAEAKAEAEMPEAAGATAKEGGNG